MTAAVLTQNVTANISSVCFGSETVVAGPTAWSTSSASVSPEHDPRPKTVLSQRLECPHSRTIIGTPPIGPFRTYSVVRHGTPVVPDFPAMSHRLRI